MTWILKISGDEVDTAYIADWSRRLGLTDIWEIILKRVGESDKWGNGVKFGENYGCGRRPRRVLRG